MKKPKLKKYIIKACIIAFFLFLIVYPLLMYITDSMYFDHFQEIYSGIDTSIMRTIKNELMSSDADEISREGLKSEEYGTGLTAADYIMKMYAYSTVDQVSVLYDREGNVVSDSSRAVFIKLYKKGYNNEVTEDYIRLETEYNDDWKEIYKEVDNAENEKIGENNCGLPKDITFNELMGNSSITTDSFDLQNSWVETKILFDEIYYKGGYFVPGRVRVRVNVISENEDERKVELYKDVLEIDMTPNDSDKYKVLRCDSDADSDDDYYYNNDMIPIVVGIPKENKEWEDYNFFINKIKKDGWNVQSFIAESGKFENSECHGFDKEFLRHFSGTTSSINIGGEIEGPEFVLVTESNCSILSTRNEGIIEHFEKIYDNNNYGLYSLDEQFNSIMDENGRYSLIWKVWIPVGIGVLIVFLVITNVIAYIRYLKTKSVYDMFAYRVQTTNAMAHDLKTPLAAISGYAENLIEQVHSDKRDYYAKSILTNVEYMDQMIHDILDLSKSESDNQQLNPEKINISDFIEEEIKSFSHLINERNLTINKSGDLCLNTDRKLLKSIIDNLLSNAVKYAEEKTEIMISVGNKGTQKNITINNRISQPIEKSIDELKKPYVKGDNSRGKRYGSGVGLAIVENVATKLKCKVVYNITNEAFTVKVIF